MSSGIFLDAFYEMNNGSIAPIRIQPETAALVLNSVTNTIPAGPADLPVRAKVSKTKRELGIGPRRVTIEFTGTPPTNYAPGGQITVPWLQRESWEDLPPLASGTYLGQAVRLVFKTAESVK